MKRAFAWILVLTVVITLTSCTPPKDGGTANPENGSMVPATVSGTSLPGDAATPEGMPVTGTGGTTEGKNALTNKDAGTIQDINKIIQDAQQYLNEETLPDMNTD